jgi:phage host-nuclease inhibitor protein Gam
MALERTDKSAETREEAGEPLHDVELLGVEVSEDSVVTLAQEEFADIDPESALSHIEANRIVKRIKECDDAVRDIQAQVEYEIAALRAKAASIAGKYARRKEWLAATYTPALEAFARKQTEGKREKSVSLLSGAVGIRLGRSSLRILDMDAAVAYAKKSGLEVKCIETVAVSALKEHFENLGEVMDFAEYTKGAESFFIK